jgi:hypothetical protein
MPFDIANFYTSQLRNMKDGLTGPFQALPINVEKILDTINDLV